MKIEMAMMPSKARAMLCWISNSVSLVDLAIFDLDFLGM